MSPAFVFIILSQLVMLNSAEKEEEIFRKCPRFNCGNLNRIGFPFTNSRNFSCGFLPVDCLRQRIQLEETGNWYKLFSILPEDTILIQDDELRQKLDKRSCDIFNNISFPDSPSVSFHLAPKSHITLFKCSSHATDPMIDDSFFSRFFTYKECKDFNIYYHKPLSDHRPISRPNCSVITLPVSTTKITGDLFTLLNANISLQVKVSKDCFKCCLRGGQCQEDSKGNFHRANLKGNNRKELKLGLAILCPVIVLGIAFLLIFITCRRHKRFPNFFSKNAYFDPSLRSGLERESVNFGIPFFSYNDLEIATNNFDASRKLGDGGAGTVYYGKLRDGREVAIKRFYKNNYKRVQQYMNEIKILTLLRHRSLISFYGCTSRTSHELILVYEFVPNGTVADHLHGDRAKPSALTWPLRMNIAIETANALVYLHASNIIHRDVKTKNILLDDNFHVKVADFGLSRLLPIDLTHASTAPQGTPGYVDPEYLQCYQLTDKSDVYSFGVVLIELISSMPAIDIKRHKHEIYLSNYAINKIQNQAINELVDPVLGFQMDFKVRRMTTLVAELAFSCLQSDKEIRPSMNEVLKDLVRIKSEEA